MMHIDWTISVGNIATMLVVVLSIGTYIGRLEAFITTTRDRQTENKNSISTLTTEVSGIKEIVKSLRELMKRRTGGRYKTDD